MADKENENGNAEITKEDVISAVDKTVEVAAEADVKAIEAMGVATETKEELEDHKFDFKEELNKIYGKFDQLESTFSDLSSKVSSFIESEKKNEVPEEIETTKEETALPIIEVKPEPKSEEVKPAKRKRFFI